ncbi:protein FATTY ACID EXPORT 3, chloroplastic-like isoform X2 [Tripterygium wilfordii]|uniref:protein FATTY ACID EXPORT 3, chloroplastic-like isoform X2 n=1 Tax=Tripterygium wilfordii TaxID=458696 RepID=UPI0018F85980|nr:protein FATTY ACID EXPORT 3, chloroplastic-like isoform X2 [Tripterygium wilfordii]
MSAALALLSIKNPNPSLSGLFPMNRVLTNFTPIASCTSSSIRLDSMLRLRCCRVSDVARCVAAPMGIGGGFVSLDRRKSGNRIVVASAASHEESHSEIEVEKKDDNAKIKVEGSEKAWKQTLESFKEQALKMQSVSEEAYEIYSKKAIVILKETSEQLKVQADKTRHDLSVLASEITEDGKEYLSTAAENSPEPVKDVVETFTSSADDLNDVSKLQDFHLGIPYGLLLSVGGFLSFMLTGSISAIRFGVILGGALLALSVQRLRSYKRGEPNDLALKGQAAIAAVIFLREISFLYQRPSFLTCFPVFVSGVVVAFYVYKILNPKQSKESDLQHGSEN